MINETQDESIKEEGSRLVTSDKMKIVSQLVKDRENEIFDKIQNEHEFLDVEWIEKQQRIKEVYKKYIKKLDNYY